MASPFKIPKKKQMSAADSAPLHASPLSRLQSPAPNLKGYEGGFSRGGADSVHAGSRLSTPSRPFFRDYVKTLLGIKSPSGGTPAANQRGCGGQRAESLSNGWRPKRASDRLLQPASPPQKKKTQLSGSSARRISVTSCDSLAELRGEEHAGSLSPWPEGERSWRREESGRRDAVERKSDAGSSPEPLNQQQKKKSPASGSDQDSEDVFTFPSRNKPSSTSLRTPAGEGRGQGRSLERAPLLTASGLMEERREKERERWREFREKKKKNRSAVLQPRPKKPKQTPTEPIVLSSEEEDEAEDGGDRRGQRTSQSGTQDSGPRGSAEIRAQQARSSSSPPPPPSFLQLDFTSLHAGLTHIDANGQLMISESSITIPLKGSEEGEVSVVASQVQGYGVWDGGVARGGTLLAGWKGPAPSLLFLRVSDAQANVLQRELTAIQSAAQSAAQSASGPVCSFLLLVLKEQLQELQAALLASILDMEEYRRGCSSSAGPSSPLDWTDGLLLLHSCPPPLDQHLLGLLGHSAVRASLRRKTGSGLQQLPSRLIQYPAPPSKGRITVTKEDLACLRGGEFLNDVIIDFYLKFLLLEGVGGSVPERSHVFSSFFYKQLSRRRAAGEDDAPSVPDRHVRHQRVKTWTRQVDIFAKDFLFVPVNQEAHWFLVVVCFPGLEEPQYEEFRPTGGFERAAEKSSFSVRSQQLPPCTQQSCRRDAVLKRPCILVMDSLKLSNHDNVCRLLRDYLQVEWDVRRGTPRLFTTETMKTSSCRVPQQDNSSDCGLYLLQYTESFLQNPVVHFDLPIRLENWFPRQHVHRKREEIRTLIMRMHRGQSNE